MKNISKAVLGAAMIIGATTGISVSANAQIIVNVNGTPPQDYYPPGPCDAYNYYYTGDCGYSIYTGPIVFDNKATEGSYYYRWYNGAPYFWYHGGWHQWNNWRQSNWNWNHSEGWGWRNGHWNRAWGNEARVNTNERRVNGEARGVNANERRGNAEMRGVNMNERRGDGEMRTMDGARHRDGGDAVRFRPEEGHRDGGGEFHGGGGHGGGGRR